MKETTTDYAMAHPAQLQAGAADGAYFHN